MRLVGWRRTAAITVGVVFNAAVLVLALLQVVTSYAYPTAESLPGWLRDRRYFAFAIALYTTHTFVTGVWCYLRRDLQPLKSRHFFLLAVSSAFGYALMLWVLLENGFLSAHYDEPDAYDFPLQCTVGRWLIDLAFPGLTLPYLLRALRLYLIFRWTKSGTDKAAAGSTSDAAPLFASETHPTASAVTFYASYASASYTTVSPPRTRRPTVASSAPPPAGAGAGAASTTGKHPGTGAGIPAQPFASADEALARAANKQRGRSTTTTSTAVGAVTAPLSSSLHSTSSTYAAAAAQPAGSASANSASAFALGAETRSAAPSDAKPVPTPLDAGGAGGDGLVTPPVGAGSLGVAAYGGGGGSASGMLTAGGVAGSVGSSRIGFGSVTGGVTVPPPRSAHARAGTDGVGSGDITSSARVKASFLSPDVGTTENWGDVLSPPVSPPHSALPSGLVPGAAGNGFGPDAPAAAAGAGAARGSQSASQPPSQPSSTAASADPTAIGSAATTIYVRPNSELYFSSTGSSASQVAGGAAGGNAALLNSAGSDPRHVPSGAQSALFLSGASDGGRAPVAAGAVGAMAGGGGGGGSSSNGSTMERTVGFGTVTNAHSLPLRTPRSAAQRRLARATHALRPKGIGALTPYTNGQMLRWLAVALLPFVAFAVIEQATGEELTPSFLGCPDESRTRSLAAAISFHTIEAVVMALAVSLTVCGGVWDAFQMRTELLVVLLSDVVVCAIQVIDWEVFHSGGSGDDSTADTAHPHGRAYGYLIFLRCVVFFTLSLTWPLVRTFTEGELLLAAPDSAADRPAVAATSALVASTLEVNPTEALGSFRALLKTPDGFESFQQYMFAENGSGLLLFYMTVAFYKDLTDPHERELEAVRIFAEFLASSDDGLDADADDHTVAGDVAARRQRLSGSAFNSDGGDTAYVALATDGSAAPVTTATSGSGGEIGALLPSVIVADLRAIIVLRVAPSAFQQTYRAHDPFSAQLFDRAQDWVFQVMRRDYFPKFQRSELYRRLTHDVYTANKVRENLHRSQLI